MGNAADAFLRHTVHTAQVASIGHGDPDVVDRSAVSVYHRTNSPLFPPDFASRCIFPISIRLSIALHIS